MKNMLISELGERELIRILLEKRDKVLTDIDIRIKDSYHDDAALIENTGEYTVVSSDMLFQHSHFPKQMTYYQMGAKVVTVNVSDILAMNAAPDSILVSMGLPPEMTIEEYEELTDGILDKCREYEITLIGGDINQNTEIVLCGTSIGKVNNEFKLQRVVGCDDLIAVTGELGSPAAALDLLCANECVLEKYEKDLVDTLLCPTVAIDESKTLRKNSEIITSITDITDGLAVELGHLHEKNRGIGFEISYEKIPFNEAIREVADKNDKDILEYLLRFGEEFELLLTLKSEEYHKHVDELGFLHVIGKTNSSDKITLIRDGVEEEVIVKGYEHLKED